MYDPRIKLLDNTLASPINLESTSVSGDQWTCPIIAPTAPKTFLNEDTCVIAHGCYPDQYSDTEFELNAENIRQFYRAGNNFVYAVDSLPLDPKDDPCNTPSWKHNRWRKLESDGGGGCSAHGGASELDASTVLVFESVFNRSTDANPFVKDTVLTRDEQTLCTANVTPAETSDGKLEGVRLEIRWKNGVELAEAECWVHTNKNSLDVYDFSRWAMHHGGNDETTGFFPIKKVALDGEAVLHFPAWHSLDRWTGNSNADWRALTFAFGRVGDVIKFDDLPRPIRSAGFAEAVGITVSPNQDQGWIEMCGSPGEVANNPTLGNRWWFGKEKRNNVGAYNQQELLQNFKSDKGTNQKQKVFNEITIFAPDQLRQRVAWALSQTFVVAEFSSAVLGDHAEVWTQYYDIFVRHAFGSYFDIMREVSFNPVMAKFLTFYGSESYSYKASVPDENFARELMQLFSVGLHRMHQDGTHMLSDDGELIPTYTNDNIVEFAKIWTGFRQQEWRGNLEQKRISDGNQIDPLKVFPERRDIFPKMDLHRGHIGDGLPLCLDLAPRHFLRIGAKFRYLGKEGVPHQASGKGGYDFSTEGTQTHPMFELDPDASSLYSTLCSPQSDGKCQFRSIVTLSANLPCNGLECNVVDGSTIRIVKIVTNGAAYYYEYQPVPCVSLTFFVGAEGGRFIENVNQFASHGSDDQLIERVCADPKAPIAAPGCCSPEGSSCFEYSCNYVDERTPFEDALQRCSDRMAPLWEEELLFPASPTPFSAAWMLFPHIHRTMVAGCPAESRGVPSEDECLYAAAAAMQAAGEPHFLQPEMNDKGPRSLQTGSWSNRPPGCIVDTHKRKVHFNNDPVGGESDDFKLVCDLPAGSGYDSDWSDASPLLCSRKRRHCWYDGVNNNNCATGFGYGDHYSTNLYWWQAQTCKLQAQVNVDGRVSIIHPGSKSPQGRRFEINSENWFLVRWLDGVFPAASTDCGGATDLTCTVVQGGSGSTCLCDIDMSTTVAFALDITATIPSQADVEEVLRIGAPPPGHFDDGVYSLCETAACVASADVGVKVYTTGSAAAPVFDGQAIFEIVVNKTTSARRTKYFMNKQSVVTIAGSSSGSRNGNGNNANAEPTFSFRNPPQINKNVDPTAQDALYETDMLLENLFYDSNVAPFVATRLIQRLVSSNPSPRYVATVAAAFRSGAYNGQEYTGKYGDMGAATAATLLDREARSLVLAADPTHGQVREPMLKLLHVMRAMEFRPRDDRNIEFDQELVGKIGQGVYRSPTVFSFFLPEYE